MADQERIKKARRPLRMNVTKYTNELEAELLKDAPDIILIRAKLQSLDKVHSAIVPLDVELQGLMLDDVAVTNDVYSHESDIIEEYEHKISVIKVKADQFLNPVNPRPPSPALTAIDSERFRRARAPIRLVVHDTIQELESEVKKDTPDKQLLKIKKSKLMKNMAEVRDLDEKLKMAMLDNKCTDDEYNAEIEVIVDYEEKYDEIMETIDGIIPHIISSSIAPPSVSSHNVHADKTYKLPKIEIKKFNGDSKDWLGFWAQFEKIHEDERIDSGDKFQYLTQAMIPGSPAKQLIDGYSQNAENYLKVVEALRERFGDIKLLKRIYFRELMTMDKIKEAGQLSKLYDKMSAVLGSLESLGVVPEIFSEVLYPFVEGLLPTDVMIAWQRSDLHRRDGSKEQPPKTELHFLREFLKEEVQNEEVRKIDDKERASLTKRKQNSINSREFRPQSGKSDVPTAAGLFAGQTQPCIFCDPSYAKSHTSQDCRRALQLPLQTKKDKIKEAKACFNCIKTGHRTDTCKTFIKCPLCTKKHFIFMCPDLPFHKKTEFSSTIKPVKTNETKAMTNQGYSREVLLQTLLVRVMGPKYSRIVRLVFDNGSQRSYIKRQTAQDLRCPRKGEEWTKQSLFGGTVTKSKRHNQYNIMLQSLDGVNVKEVEVIDEPVICTGISRISKGPWMAELEQEKIKVTDVWSESPDIEILIGSDYYGHCVTGRIFQLQCGLTAFETIFGWSIGGKVPTRNNENIAMTVITMLTSSEEKTVQDFWDLESIGITDPVDHQTKKEKELSAKEHFLKTVSRSLDGRYTVSLPWINKNQDIPSNRMVAEKRLANATKKLHDANKYDIYDSIFKAWEEEGIIEKIQGETNPCHYLPHRPVFKPESLTTPVRPVFDASCKIGRNPSLNDCLEKGPNLLEEIPAILLRFRFKNIGVLSDIRKAFLMIEVQEEDRNFLRFLWWEDPTCKKIQIYRHNRVVFGVNCSPFLLGAVIEHHLRQVDNDDKPTAEKLLRSLYVDNCVTSVDSYDEYNKFKTTSTRIMADAKMELRQWEYSSGWESGVGPHPVGCGLDFSRTDSHIKMATVLGLKWNKKEDTLSCHYEKLPIPEKITKRTILSYAQKIFDPLGFLSPALLCPKIILQEAWSKKSGWDEELSSDIVERFEKWTEDLNLIEKIQIPRQITNCFRDQLSDNKCQRQQEEFQIHTFCDASKYAFATAIYLRSVYKDHVTVQLLLSKSRVAPINKKITIPRLELLACLIGSRLTKLIKEALNLEEITSYYWSDSTTALSWIKRNDEWGTFVGNRVKEICGSTDPEHWHYVPGIYNPADLPSRGCSFRELLMSRWWEGPEWLQKSENEWPTQQDTVINEAEIIAEKKKVPTIQMLATANDNWYCKICSSYIKTVRVFGWMFRFINNIRKVNMRCANLSAQEIDQAEKKLLAIVQKESFPLDEDTICGLRVIKDEDQLIRVKTKLFNRDDTFSFRLPILLPNNHPLVDQLIRYVHLNNSHAGTQFLMGKIRENYWIVQGRKAIRSIVRSCVICRRYTSKSPTAPEASLPENRIKNAKPFEITGVDLAGPLFLKNGSKVWIVLFTCAVYRAIHLEMVDSQSTDAFLWALSRFVARRGKPTTIYSDNGTNFHGAVNIFRSLDWKKITRTCSRELKPINWIFNPPSAAWWGGWWERLIRSIKDLLKRTLGNKKLGEVPLMTKLCEVEAIINDRPLTYVTEDQDDLIPLTSGMFIQNTPISSCPEANASEGDGLRKRYKEMKEMSLELQHRFRREYLAQLVHKGKSKKCHGFNIGDVVLVGDDNKKRLEWPMARIVQMFPGKDGTIRAAKVKTSTGVLIRPIPRLYPLEVSSSALPFVTSDVIKTAVRKKKEDNPRPNNDEDKASTPLFEKCIITRSGRLVKKPQRL